MKRILMGLLTALLVSACQETGDTGGQAAGAERFPGFAQVGKEGRASRLYVELNTVKQEDDLAYLKMVRVLDEGYVIQDAMTDCRGSFKALEGVQYRDDGSSEKKYPGDDQPMPFVGKPEIAALVKMACDKAGMAQVDQSMPSQAAEKPQTDSKQQAVETPLPETAPDTLKTRIGLLEIGRSDFKAPPDSLVLNGKVIYKDEGNYLALHQMFSLPDHDAVLFSSNCGGTACQTDDFAFLLVRQNADPAVVKAEGFYAYPSAVKTRRDGDDIRLDLGFSDGKRKLAVLNGEQLAIRLEEVPAQPLEEAQCKWLHSDAMPACVEARANNPDCSDPQGDFSGAVMRGVAAMSDYPGFVQQGFDQQCQQACRDGKASDYTIFGGEVCSKPKPANAAPTPTPLSAAGKADIFNGCEDRMGVAGQALECMQGNLQPQKDRLNAAYKSRFDALPADQQAQLETEQKAWLEKRNADCGKLTDETPAADGMGIAECVFKAVVKRADELEKMPRPANSTNQSNTSTATQGEWYTSTAKPVLVVRSTPDVTGKKIGTVPEGDKVKVLEKNVKADFISGYSGSWVKIEWQNEIGYVFDVFLNVAK